MHVQGLGTGVMLCDELSQVAQNCIGMQECNPRRPFCVILGGETCLQLVARTEDVCVFGCCRSWSQKKWASVQICPPL